VGRTRSKVVDRDLGWKRIKALAKAEGSYAKVGLLGNKADRTGEVDNVTIGVIHEFGSPAANIPERSWLRSTFDAKREELYRLMRELVGGIYDGKMTPERVLGIAGAQLAAEMKKTITTGQGVPPPNAPSTVARKLAKAKQAIVRKATAGAAARSTRAADLAAAIFGDHGDTSRLDRMRRTVSGRAVAQALNRVHSRRQAAKLASLVFGEGGVRTLVDTGRMVAAISWQVVRGKKDTDE
jgi:hypothetical protein